MCRQIVWIDRLKCLELCDGVIVTMLLIVGDAQFPSRIAALRILSNNLSKSAISASECRARRSTSAR